MINAIGSSDLKSYLLYLKEQNQNVSSSSLSFDLEDYLDEADAESVIKISDTTLSNAGEDVVRANADKLSSFGVSSNKIDNVFDSKNDNKSEDSSVQTSGVSLSALKEKSALEKQYDTTSVNETSAIDSKNNASRKVLQSKIDVAKAKNQVLQEEYNTLKATSTTEQDNITQVGDEEKLQYEKDTNGKVDQVQAMQSEKYQAIEANQENNTKQNASTDGFKIDSANSFQSVNTTIDSSSDSFDNSTGYNLGGANLFNVGSEVTSTGESINDRALSITEAAWAQLSAANSMASSTPEEISAKSSAQAQAQAVYDRGVDLVYDSIDTMGMGRTNLDDSHKYYNESNKYVNSGNMFMAKSTIALNDVNNSNNDLSSKIVELQSQKSNG